MEQKKFYMRKIDNLVNVKKIATIHYQELSEKYVFQGESHNFWELAYVDKNKVTYCIDDQEIIVNAGEVIFLKPNVFHSLKCEKDANLFIISFASSSNSLAYFNDKKLTLDDKSIRMLSRIIREAQITYNLPKFNPDLDKLELLENPALGGEEIIKNYLEIFLIQLLRIEATKPASAIIIAPNSNDLEIEEKIVSILKNNIYNNISLDDICLEMRYGKTFICTQFKKAMNTSIINYYINLKINEAKNLILKGYNFSEVARLLKFDSLSHFTNTFKKYSKMTPRQYKKSVYGIKN